MYLNPFSFSPNNSAAKSFVLLLLILAWLPAVVNGQFFTKTSKSIPRLGRRSDPSLQALRAMVTEDMPPFGEIYQKYDTNDDWCLSPEELWQVPFIRMAEMSRGHVRPPLSQTATSNELNRGNEERDESFRGIISNLNEK